MSFAISDIQPAIQDALKFASNKTGVDFQYLYEKAFKESSCRVDAVSKTSSAAGLFQFIDSTWKSVMKRYGSECGVDASKCSKQELLDMRKDPVISSFMAAKLTRENQAHLKDKLGRAASNKELYLAHFMGPSNAVDFIKKMQQSPEENACVHFTSCANSNQAIFFERDGSELSLRKVYSKLTASIDNGSHSKMPNRSTYPSLTQSLHFQFGKNTSLLASDMFFELMLLRT